MLYFTNSVTIDDQGPTKLIDEAPIDRKVLLSERDGNAYISFHDWTQVQGTDIIGVGPTEFVLPAGTSLWGRAYTSNETCSLHYMVTSVGR